MNDRNYWLHRISHKMEVSYPLLEKGYLSIGFSDFLKNEGFLEKMVSEECENKDKIFDEENIAIWGKLYRTRNNLWRFLCEFKIGDWVVVPSWGVFSIYEIVGRPIAAGMAIKEDPEYWNSKHIYPGGDNGRYLTYDGNETIDLGFAIQVKAIAEGIPREDYAENNLLSRMKIQYTNADITGLSKEINEALERYLAKKPINIYAETVNRMSEQLKSVIDTLVSNNQFEKLIKLYFEKIGADDVIIPNKQSGEGIADGDVIATFDNIKIKIIVQVKHHTGTTGGRAVDQVSKYQEQNDKEETDNEYTSIAWVITSADNYSDEAIYKAADMNVRLINGPEFRKMLIDVGVGNLRREFDQ